MRLELRGGEMEGRGCGDSGLRGSGGVGAVVGWGAVVVGYGFGMGVMMWGGGGWVN